MTTTKYPGLADHLRKWGLKVVEVKGWQERSAKSTTFTPNAIFCHHTASSPGSNAPALGIVTNGRPGVPGPLSQFVLGRDGTVYVVSGNRANHAGVGGALNGIPEDSGNRYGWGIEAENSGRGETWGELQLTAYYRLCAALMDLCDIPLSKVVAHKEWSPGRKSDPAGINMNTFRQRVAEAVAAGPAKVPGYVDKTPAGDPILKRGSKGQAVMNVQNALKITKDGDFGQATHDAVVIFQRRCALVGDGIVDEDTWDALRGHISTARYPNGDPKLSLGAYGQAVVNVQNALGIRNHGWYNTVTEDAVADFQLEVGLEGHGDVDDKTWAALRKKVHG